LLLWEVAPGLELLGKYDQVLADFVEVAEARLFAVTHGLIEATRGSIGLKC